jgi:hypothetical protein
MVDFQDEIKNNDKQSITHTDLQKPNNKLVNA